jgi:hypothetical protein
MGPPSYIYGPLFTETWFFSTYLYINVHMHNINGKFDFVWVVLLEVMACKMMIVYWYHNNEQYISFIIYGIQ